MDDMPWDVAAEARAHGTCFEPSEDAPSFPRLHATAEKGSLQLVEWILSCGTAVGSRDQYGRTAFMVAVRAGHADVARALLEAGAVPSPRTLHSAVLSNHVGVVRVMMAAGFHPGRYCLNDRKSLHAARGGMVDLLVGGGAHVEARTKAGRTPLHFAVPGYDSHADVETAIALLNQGADVNARDFSGDSALHLCSAEVSAEMAEVLLQSGAHVGARNRRGETPLHVAAALGNTAVSLALLAGGACVFLRDHKGRSVLDRAALRGREDTVRVVVNSGSGGGIMEAVDGRGLGAIHWAKGKAVVDILVDAGADVNTQDQNGNGPLHLSYMKDNFTICALLNRGADVNAANNSQHTPVHLLALHGKDNAGLMEYMLRQGARVNARGRRGHTPLHFSANRGRTAVARALLQAGADPMLRDENQQSSLDCAVLYEREDIVREIIAHPGVDVTATGSLGFTPLHIASTERLVRMLLGAGASPHARDANGVTPLHGAHSKSLGAVAELVYAGAEVDASNHAAYTPLHLLALRGKDDDAEIIKFMIRKGASVNALDNHGRSPIHLAVAEGRVAAVLALAEAGADVSIRDNREASCLEVAVGLRLADTARILIDHGADVEATDGSGSTAIFFAANKATVDALVQAGADVDARDDYGRTPLMLETNIEVIKALLGHGMDVDAQDEGGSTALIYGSAHAEVMELLLDHGANAATADIRVGTALHFAEDSGVVSMLINHGADPDAQDEDGCTPLMNTCFNASVARALVDHGAQVNIQNCRGETVLHFISDDGPEEDMLETLDLLLKSGADETLRDAKVDLPVTRCLEMRWEASTRLLLSAPQDRAWRRRGNFIMSMWYGDVWIVRGAKDEGSCLAEWRLDLREGHEGIFRTVVGFL